MAEGIAIYERPRVDPLSNFTVARTVVQETLFIDPCFQVTIFPKRPLVAREVTDTNPINAHAIQTIRAYLDGLPIYVEGNYREFYDKYPQFSPNNQFRGNTISKVTLGMQVLERNYRLEGKVNLADQCRIFYMKILERVRGNETDTLYDSMSQSEKLGVVYFIEDSVVNFMEVLAS